MTTSEPSAEHQKSTSSSGDMSRTEPAKAAEESRAEAGDAPRPQPEDNDFATDNSAGDEAADGGHFGSDDDEVADISVKELHQLTEERDEYKDKFIRKVAELDNVIRRTAKEKSDLAKFGNEGFIKELLPVLDSFDQALPNDDEAKDVADDSKDFAAGILLVKKKLLDVFSKNGVEVIDSKGQPFDPNLHQAIQKIEDASVTVETITEQYQKGYTLNGRLVRPAMVVVAVPTESSAASTDAADTKPEDAKKS